MSFDPFAHSADLGALVADGYELEITGGGHLVVKHVPYRTADGEVRYGGLVTKLEFEGDITVKPLSDHTMCFVGTAPCNVKGPLRPVIESGTIELESGPKLVADHRMSYKPPEPYPAYYAKVTAYVANTVVSTRPSSLMSGPPELPLRTSPLNEVIERRSGPRP